MKLYKATSKAFFSYKYGTGGNSELDSETLMKKLNRNIWMARPEYIDDNTTIYHYGSLKIKADEQLMLITEVKNTYDVPLSWGKDKKKFKKINKQLKIPLEV